MDQKIGQLFYRPGRFQMSVMEWSRHRNHQTGLYQTNPLKINLLQKIHRLSSLPHLQNLLRQYQVIAGVQRK
jgi:hypothetical protein